MSQAQPFQDEEAVAAYLAEHPDFFIGREQLLLGMRLQQAAPGTVSLVERQASLLRERIAMLEATLRELHAQAHANAHLAARMQRLALALIAASGPCEVLEATRTRLCTDFDLTAVLFGLEEGHGPSCASLGDTSGDAAWRPLFALAAAQIPRSSAPLRGLLAAQGLPESASLAAIPLQGEGLRGAMLLVKRDPQGFRPDMGTLFLEQIGELVSAALAAPPHGHLGAA